MGEGSFEGLIGQAGGSWKALRKKSVLSVAASFCSRDAVVD